MNRRRGTWATAQQSEAELSSWILRMRGASLGVKREMLRFEPEKGMLKDVTDKETWDSLVRVSGHPLQLWGWGEVKANHGPWKPYRFLVQSDGEVIGGAQVLQRRLPGPFKHLLYVPRGPFGDPDNIAAVMSELVAWAEERGGVELKIEPDWLTFPPDLPDWRPSKSHILLARTTRLDLGKSLDDLLANTTKKTRQYIRKSEKSGVTVRRVTAESDVATCLEIYRETAQRADFALHDDSYYYDLAQFVGEDNRIYLAEKDGEALSFLWNLRTQAVEFELYGGVNVAGQELRSNWILKWQAITDAHESGVRCYDMNGLLNDGVSSFKQGFSSEESLLVGAWDKPLSPLYFAWETLLPTAKTSVQKVNKIRQSLRRG